MSTSPDDLDDIDGYFDRLPFDPRDTDYRQDIQDLYGQAGDDVIGVMEQLVEQREDATESAIESMFRETYNQGIIDGAMAAVEEAGDDVDNHFPNGFYGDGGFMSPTYNFGNMSGQQSGGFMNPNYNFGRQAAFAPGGNGSTGDQDIRGSWDDYDWGDWDQIREPAISYTEFIEENSMERSQENVGSGALSPSVASSPIIYNPQVVSGGGFFSDMFSGENVGASEDPFEDMDMPWGDQAS